MNTHYRNHCRNIRKNRIDQLASEGWEPSFAAMYVDQNSPMTTNKKMLTLCGYDIDKVDVDNYRVVLAALEFLGIVINVGNATSEHIASVLNDVLDEPINEIWGGEYVTEVIDLV